jgi:hypothetical protein
MLCSKVHRQKGFNLLLFSYKIATQVCNTLTARLIPLVHKLAYRQANLDMEDLWSNQVRISVNSLQISVSLVPPTTSRTL